MNLRRGESEVLRLTQDLIALESHIDAPGREASIGQSLVQWFQDRGIDSRLQTVEGVRANVVAIVPGSGGPSLMFNGHLDTVPAGDMISAFEPTIREDVLWGRGACDMKGAIAAMACTLAECARASTPLSGDLLFTGVVGEETGSIGVKSLMEANQRADYVVVGEPTSLRVGIAHKGACFIRISLTGRGAHGSRPDEGVNAVSHASRVILALETELRAELASRVHPLLGQSTVSVGRIRGGIQPNIVAAHCLIDIDRRTLPQERGTVEEIQRLVGRICDPIADLTWRVEEMPETALVPHGALGTEPDTAFVQHAQATCRAHGLPDEPVGVTYWTDGGHLSASGIETIILGPGDIANAHGPNDRVDTDELELSVSLYKDLVRRMLCAS